MAVDYAGAPQPEAFSPDNELGRRALQTWADGDDAGTGPLPVIPAIPPHLAGIPVPHPPEGSGPWRIIRDTLRSHRVRPGGTSATGENPAQLSDSPAASRPDTPAPGGLSAIGSSVAGPAAAAGGSALAGVPVGATAPDLPVISAPDGGADTRADLPAMPADGTPARAPALAADGAADTRADLPATAVGRDLDVTAADLPVISSGDSGRRAPVDLSAAAVRRDPDGRPVPAADDSPAPPEHQATETDGPHRVAPAAQEEARDTPDFPAATAGPPEEAVTENAGQPPAAPGPGDEAQTTAVRPPVPAVGEGAAQTRADLPAIPADGDMAQTRADLPAMAADRDTALTRADLPVQPAETGPGGVPPQRPPVAGQEFPVPPAPRPGAPTAAQRHGAAGRDKERGKELARLNCPRLHCNCADPTICPSITELRRPLRPARPLDEPPAPGRQDPGYTRLMAQAVVNAATTPIPVIRPDHRADAGAGPGTAQHGGNGSGRSRWGKRRNPASFRAGGPPAPQTGEPYAPADLGVPPAPRPSDGAPWPPAPPVGAGDRFGRATSQQPRPNVAGQAGAPPAPAATPSGTAPAPRSSAPAPRPSAGDRGQATTGQRRPAASQQEKDLARRNCLRLRCVCPDPTVCPALAVKRSPATSGAQMGWQMPAQERTQAPGFTTMMSLAVASAATMPIPIMRGAPGHGFASAATRRLPVVPADPAPYTGDGTARSPAGKLLGRLKTDHMLRNTLFLIMSTGLQAALGFAFWIVVARLFNTADVGRGSSLISAIGLIAFFALLGLNSAVVRYLPTAKDPNSLITATVLLVGGFGALVAGIYIFATPIFAPKIAFVAHQPLLALGFVLLAAATAVNLLTDSVFIASRKASYTALTDGGIGGVAKIGFSVALAGTGAYGVFSASAGGFAAAALASLILMATAVHWRPSLKSPVQILKPLIKFSFANYAGNAMGMLPTLVVPLIILDRLGPSSAAYYFVAFQLANLLYAAGGAIEQTFLAEGSQADADWRNMLRRSLRLLVALFIPMCLVVVVGAHWALLAFGVKYSQFGTPSLMLLAAAAVPIGANDWLQTVLRLAGALRAIVWSGVTCAISVCALAWFLAPFGLTALSASWLIGSALGALVAGIGFMAVRRRDLQHPPRRPQQGRARASSAYEGRHVPRPAAEGQPERWEQPVG